MGKQVDAQGVQLIAHEDKTEEEHIGNNKNEIPKVPDEEAEYDIQCDDISGKHLDPATVQQARAVEIEHHNKIGVYVQVLFRGRSKSPTGEMGGHGQRPPGQTQHSVATARHSLRARAGRRPVRSSTADRVTVCCDLVRDHRSLGEGDHGKRRESRVHVRFLQREQSRGTW